MYIVWLPCVSLLIASVFLFCFVFSLHEVLQLVYSSRLLLVAVRVLSSFVTIVTRAGVY